MISCDKPMINKEIVDFILLHFAKKHNHPSGLIMLESIDTHT
jgi:hypothetical protein